MDEVLNNIAHYAAIIAEVIAFIFIIVGIFRSVWIYFKKTILVKMDHPSIAEIRNTLGHHLSLGLEFLIGADILKTAISPSWDELGQLAAIVGIRTVLNFFLLRELDRESLKKIV